ncbi:MAG: hypothetical protein HC840_05570 [Leptolyngbyaceae cyanobacterium RM2_2_4]|nr:hypothetical protein [Leptolyngbyaceae cyanobacterium SM1_4_3]NJO49021.1 hypothetical protein [Leptolyngbyaceae cyanobacterium RM2_2_4]
MATKTKTVRQRVQFAFNADADSVVGTVFQYLIKNHCFSSREGKRKGVDAIVAFYKPFAYQGSTVSEGELQAIARDAVELLSRQIELICSSFDLERPGTRSQPFSWNDLKAELRQTLSELLAAELLRVHQEPVESAIAISDSLFAPTADEEFNFNEDNLLGDLCSNAEAAA